jgi:hypothetical protein
MPYFLPARTGLHQDRSGASFLTRRGLIFLCALVILSATGLTTITSAQPTNCTNLLSNGGFEGSGNWSSVTTGSYPMIGNYLAHTGTQSAHLAGVDNATDTLTTALTLPVDKPSVTLRFWWQIQTEEESNEFDGLTVLVADATGTVLRSLLTLGSGSAANQWQRSDVDLSEFAGQSVQIKFVAQTDGSLVTDFFIDDVEVAACAAGGQGFRLFLPVTKR